MRNTNGLRLRDAFATPLFFANNPAAAELNPQLAAHFLQAESEGAAFRNQDRIPAYRYNIFDSRRDLFNWPDACVQSLARYCLDSLVEAAMEINDYPLDQAKNLKITGESWFHITHFGGYHGTHNHPLHSWSGVYMVSPGGSPDEGQDLGGIFSFMDPRPHANMHIDAGNKHWREQYLLSSRKIPMSAGDLMLFPSYLQHDVSAYFGREPRITVAFNANLSFQS